MIIASEAKKLLLKKFKGHIVESCVEWGDGYIIAIKPKGVSGLFLDSVYRVDKNTEEITHFSPIDHPEFLDASSSTILDL